jgi:hypothetical protein
MDKLTEEIAGRGNVGLKNRARESFVSDGTDPAVDSNGT